MKYIFIAVNYNGATHTENYLQSLQEISLPIGDILEAIIVDNRSTEAQRIKVEQSVTQRPFARFIALDDNPGYFRGLNAGIDSCPKNENTLLIIGNNDLKFASDFLTKLKDTSYEEDVLVIAPNIVTLEGRRQNPHVVTKVSTLELVKARIYFSHYYVGQAGSFVNRAIRALVRKVHSRKGVSNQIPELGRMRIKRGIGACYVLTPHFFRHHERLDDRVFLWGEEALLSHQVESAGGYTLYEPSIKVTHCESASVRFIEKRDRYEMVKASYKIYRQYL